MHNAHIEKLVTLIKTHGYQGVAINPSPSLTYLSGLHLHLMERPSILIITQHSNIVMILPKLEQGKIGEDSPIISVFTYGDDPATWSGVFRRAGETLEIESGKIGVEPTMMRFLEISYLHQALPGVKFVDGSQVFAQLRIRKDADEIAKMRKAAEIAQVALNQTLRGVREGMTEKEIANELVIQLLRSGSDPKLPFEPIVAIGENSANPHAVPTDRALKQGDVLLIDWGANFEGYFSDITRTFTFGEVDPEIHTIATVVRQANQAGRKAGKPGLTAGVVDQAVRSVITAAGYGEAFTHRTGHGLGMEAHEAPYIFEENQEILEKGMTFTVEPGIYLPGKGGVRIEDDVVVTETGLESLTDLPRQVLSLDDPLLSN